MEAQGKPDAVIKYLAQINGAIANLQTEVERVGNSFQKETESLRRDRNEDIRNITARVASIGTQVSYLRENVCGAVNRNVS